MNSINYFKLDVRLMNKSLRYYVMLPFIAVMMFLSNSLTVGIGYMFFILVIMVTYPFSITSNEKCEKMYYMFPSKISSMVLGRYLYLISMMIIVWIINGSVIGYYYNIGKIDTLEVGAMCLTGILATIICFLQYPMYYKFGVEKGRMLSMLLYMIPAFLVFFLPSLLSSSSFIIKKLNNILDFAMSSKITITMLSLLIIVIVGTISYLISFFVCKNKEI